MPTTTHRSGYVAILGRPNAGKSTLMNALIGSQLSIATHKAQTTRHQIMGIFSDDDLQVIFLDTPGIIDPRYELQKAMMRFVEKAEKEADILLCLVDLKSSFLKHQKEHKRSTQTTEDEHENSPDSYLDHELIEHLRKQQKPVLLVLNKVDAVPEEWTQKLTNEYAESFRFSGVHTISALQEIGLNELITTFKDVLPQGPALFPKDELSEHPLRFFVSEFIREQLFLNYHEELPYSATVEIVQYSESTDIDHIMADIIVNRASQKGMIIGKKGAAIKQLGIQSRKRIEAFIEKQVHLELHVKVRDKWRENKHMVRNLGYRE